MVGPWLLYRLVRLLEMTVVTDMLVDCCEYSSNDAARLMPYLDVGFSGCVLLITVVAGCKQWLSNVVMHKFVIIVFL